MMQKAIFITAAVALVCCTSRIGLAADPEPEPITMGSRLELFVDDLLIDRLNGARLELHSPQPREIVLRFDQPWEGLYSGYETVLKDGDVFRFYYRGMPVARHARDVEVTCVAESRDGIQWTRPQLGLIDQGRHVRSCRRRRRTGRASRRAGRGGALFGSATRPRRGAPPCPASP